MPTCKECGYTSTSNNFHTCQSPYHDLRCPKCQTTHINTTDLFKLKNKYGYGNNNTLKMEE